VLERVEWCTLCSSRPADGVLTILINDIPEKVPACEVCVWDKTKVEFI
jgi:hypothetical protein